MSARALKAALIDAHRRQDWETAKHLSALKARQKPKAVCEICCVPIKHGRRCLMHRARNHAMQAARQLRAA